MVVTGMYHSCSLSSLCLKCAVNNQQKHIQVPRLVHLILPKSCFDMWLECQVTVVSKLNFNKRVCKKYWLKKNSWIWIRIQVSCSTHWAIWLWFTMKYCSSFLHFFVFTLLQNAIWPPHYLTMTNLKEEDDGFVMLSSWYVDFGSPKRVIDATDWPDFSFVYII